MVIPDLIGELNQPNRHPRPDRGSGHDEGPVCTAALKPLSVNDIDIDACDKTQQASHHKRLKIRHISATKQENV